MIINILTLFPDIIKGAISSSIIKRAIEEGVVIVNIIDYRKYSDDKNKKVDDYTYGGGAGMIIGLQPIVDCLKSIDKNNAYKILTTPSGNIYNQEKAKALAKEKEIIIICGHYEGIDDRIDNYINEKISIGDYILTGGEIASCCIMDSIIRLLPNALGNLESSEIESFDNYLLEYPQFTRPYVFDDYKVPDILLSGNHEQIRKWRKFKSIESTYKNRPDLLDKSLLSKEETEYLEKIKEGKEFSEK